MSRISLSPNASGTGTLSIAAPNTNSDFTLTLPAESGTVLTTASDVTASQLPAGSVLQVVQAVKTDIVSTTSTSFADVTGLSVSITPSSSSNKVLIQLTLGGIGNPNNAIIFNLVRDATTIAQPDSGSAKGTINVFPGGGTGIFNSAITWLDSPSTTSATTYKVQWRVDASTGYLNRHTANTNYNSVSSITVMEIAG